jgi:dynein light chain LC8-type
MTDQVAFVGNLNVVYTEMNEADQSSTLEIATNALKTMDKTEKINYYKDVAQSVKAEMDSTKGGTWNVIVGTSFGSYVTHETRTMTHFYIGSVGFLIWRYG